MKEKILGVINREQYFLMYRGGAGGEFLSNLISENSTKFRNYDSSSYSPGLNRTQISLPKFYQCLTSVKCKTQSNDDLVRKMMKSHQLNDFNIFESINEAHAFLDSGPPPLIRIHYTFSDCFNLSNTWIIVQDESKWFDYTSNLLCLKSGIRKLDREEVKGVFYYRLSEIPERKQKVDQALEYIEKNNIKTLYGIQYEPLFCDPNILDISFDELFNTDPVELIHQYGKFFDQPYEEFYSLTMKRINNRMNVIPFSKIFEKGYIENIFGVERDLSKDIKDWHDKNLALLSQHGFEIDKYLHE